ncbi:MAG TPA: GntR family transcriptional regulator [Phycisphaerae bacterium]|nr:GntR family transcriptional regulator [Phycisphaerae bacterium]
MSPFDGGRPDTGAREQSPRLSYKFQRLREQIRAAIVGGEFSQRLPGERELGRRFNANAKTINKALCDLSSEGLLVRQIGRGTFIADSAGEARRQKSLSLIAFMPSAGAETQLQKRLYEAVLAESLQRRCTLERIEYGSSSDGRVDIADWPAPCRRMTQGLLFIPSSPLNGRTGMPGESLWLEAHRRRVPAVMLGACASPAKSHVVVPDFVDAGFRLAEHLFRLDCESAVAIFGHETVEITSVLSGCRTAAARDGAAIHACSLRNAHGNGVSTLSCIDACVRKAAGARNGRSGPMTGVILIGLEALRFARANDQLSRRWREGEIAFVTLLDPGDTLAADMGMTSYEVPIDRIAAWGLQLVSETTSGQRPVEVLIPGELKLRNSIAAEAPRGHDLGGRHAIPNRLRSEIVI